MSAAEHPRVTRQRVENTIEYLIGLLDEIDGDANLEAEPDLEPDCRDNGHVPNVDEADKRHRAGSYFAILNHTGADWPPRTQTPTRRIRSKRCTPARDGVFIGPDGHRYFGQRVT